MSSYFRHHIQLLLHILIFIDKRFSPQPYSKLFEEGYGEEHFSPKKFLPIIIPPPTTHTKKKKSGKLFAHANSLPLSANFFQLPSLQRIVHH